MGNSLTPEQTDTLECAFNAMTAGNAESFKTHFQNLESARDDLTHITVCCHEAPGRGAHYGSLAFAAGAVGNTQIINHLFELNADEAHTRLLSNMITGAMRAPNPDAVYYLLETYQPDIPDIGDNTLRELVGTQQYDTMAYVLAYCHMKKETEKFWPLTMNYAVEKRDDRAVEILLDAQTSFSRTRTANAGALQPQKVSSSIIRDLFEQADGRVRFQEKMENMDLTDSRLHIHMTKNWDSLRRIRRIGMSNVPLANDLFLAALRGRFNFVLKGSGQGAVPLTRKDLYQPQTSAVRVVDLLRWSGRLKDIFTVGVWGDNKTAMGDFYRSLKPYDRYLCRSAFDEAARDVTHRADARYLRSIARAPKFKSRR